MNENNNIMPKNQWANSLTFKLSIIGAMILLLLIPLRMVKKIIIEREDSNSEVDREMIDLWGNQQNLTGPILNIPILIPTEGKDGKIYNVKNWIHIMPDRLNIHSHINPETRKRGIFKSTVYTSEIKIDGSFKPNLKEFKDKGEILYNETTVSMGITDNRGIKGTFKLLFNNTPFEVEPGLRCQDLMHSGINTQLSTFEESVDKEINFDIEFSLSGTKSLYFTPIGKQTKAALTSSWKDPKFSGKFLPLNREVNDSGFSAEYEITNLNRTFPQQWIGTQYSLYNSSFGVDLYIPNNHYQKSLRSAKYGILFIILTTLIFLFIELYKKKEIHYLQYLLVSLALVLFFSILTALSEHIGFNSAYMAASIAIISLIVSYSKLLLKENQLVYWVAGLLTTLYSFLFVLLQLNDYAFLVGNIGLFIILAIIMKVSSKLQFKELKAGNF